MEKLDIYDDKKHKTGKVIVRGVDKCGENENILLTILYLKWKDKYLIQKVTPNKGGNYAIAGGHVPSGHSSKEQAVLECEEEMGIKLVKKKLKYIGDFHEKTAFFDVYLYELDKFIPENEFKLQESEVESVHWMTKEEIDKVIEQGNFRESSKGHYLKLIR